MNCEKEKPEMPDKLPKAEEPEQSYGIKKEEPGNMSEAEFEKQLKKALTLEQAKAESIRRIRKWWGK